MSQLDRDREAILTVMRSHKGPVLWSQIQLQAGELLWEAFDDLIRREVVRSVFPEATPGNSGRQFWELAEPMPAPSHPALEG